MYYPMLRFKKGEVDAVHNTPVSWSKSFRPVWFVESKNQIHNAIEHLEPNWSGWQIIDVSRYKISSLNKAAKDALVATRFSLLIHPSDYADLPKAMNIKFNLDPGFRITASELIQALNVGKLRELLASVIGLDRLTPLLIVDCGDVGEPSELDESRLLIVLRALNNFGIRNIALGCGAFPKSLEKIVGEGTVPRYDRMLFDRMQSGLETKLHFCDYGTLNPDWSMDEIRRSKHTAIRYTLSDRWLVLRQPGKDTEAIIGLAQLLVIHPDYKSEDFSWADKNWKNKTLNPPKAGPGNAAGHVTEFMNHHFAHVIKIC